jgi:tRNA nucleotidyltransferase (CCA-adding enzyme)
MRRDFTVNAMAYNPSMGLYDPYGGVNDARMRTIRAVGDPYLRFSEDALRILRALRFASVLGFTIEDGTASAARDKAHLIDGVSRERVYVELKKLVMGVDATRVLTEYSEILAPSLSGLTVARTPEDSLFSAADFCTRLASLFLLNSTDAALRADEALTALKTDKLTRTRTKTMLEHYEAVDFADVRSVLRSLARYGDGTVGDVLGLGILMGRYGERERHLLAQAIASGVPYTLSSLAVGGGDVATLGFKGEMIGVKLKELLEAVIDGEVENEKAPLLNYIGN